MPPNIRNRAVFRKLSLIILGSILFCQSVYALPNPETGTRREYYDNGKIRLETIFKKGHVVRSRSFYRNGQLLSEFRYKAGVLRSKRTFYENGILSSTWSIKTGVMKFYNRDGELTHESKYQP